MGGTFYEILSQTFWPDYFPHVSPEHLKQGFYRRIHALQGHRGTYYSGAIMGFERTGTVAEHARWLVDTYFT